MGMDLLSTKDGRGIYTGAGTALQLNTNKKEYECVSDENSINLKLQTKKSYTCILVATSNT